MIRIGSFSRIAQISVGQLRYYDDIGLLKAAYVDPQSGYRYYEIPQLKSLNRILALKDMGLSLEDIARLLAADVSVDEMRALLQLRKAQIERALQEELDQLRRVEMRLQTLTQQGEIPAMDVVIKQVEAQNVLSLRQSVPDRSSVRTMYGEMSRLLGLHSSKGLPRWFGVCHQQVAPTGEYDWEAGLLLEAPERVELAGLRGFDIHLRELPAQEMMATTICTTAWPTIPDAFESLRRWVDTQGYQITGPHREIYLHPDFRRRDESLVTELQFPICRAG